MGDKREAGFDMNFKRIQLESYQSSSTCPPRDIHKIILNFLKKRLEGTEGKWVDELPRVL
ncbi:unnamed protein product [Prunus armeniaca]